MPQRNIDAAQRGLALRNTDTAASAGAMRSRNRQYQLVGLRSA
jgi:hypothetical protein